MNYVQIGTNDGNDEFRSIISSLNSVNVYLFEPNPSLIPIIEGNYSHLRTKHNIHIYNKGVVTDCSIHTLNVGNSPAHSSIINRGNIHGNTIEFEPITFNQFCKENNIFLIDLLCIDCEGYDYQILNSIDLDQVNIKKIICEIWPYEDKDIETGPKYFNNVIRKKYFKYDINQITFGDMSSYEFIKKD